MSKKRARTRGMRCFCGKRLGSKNKHCPRCGRVTRAGMEASLRKAAATGRAFVSKAAARMASGTASMAMCGRGHWNRPDARCCSTCAELMPRRGRAADGQVRPGDRVLAPPDGRPPRPVRARALQPDALRRGRRSGMRTMTEAWRDLANLEKRRKHSREDQEALTPAHEAARAEMEAQHEDARRHTRAGESPPGPVPSPSPARSPRSRLTAPTSATATRPAPRWPGRPTSPRCLRKAAASSRRWRCRACPRCRARARSRRRWHGTRPGRSAPGRRSREERRNGRGRGAAGRRHVSGGPARLGAVPAVSRGGAAGRAEALHAHGHGGRPGRRPARVRGTAV
jgi:hypothetical protein